MTHERGYVFPTVLPLAEAYEHGSKTLAFQDWLRAEHIVGMLMHLIIDDLVALCARCRADGDSMRLDNASVWEVSAVSTRITGTAQYIGLSSGPEVLNLGFLAAPVAEFFHSWASTEGFHNSTVTEPGGEKHFHYGTNRGTFWFSQGSTHWVLYRRID